MMDEEKITNIMAEISSLEWEDIEEIAFQINALIECHEQEIIKQAGKQLPAGSRKVGE